MDYQKDKYLKHIHISFYIAIYIHIHIYDSGDSEIQEMLESVAWRRVMSLMKEDMEDKPKLSIYTQRDCRS